MNHIELQALRRLLFFTQQEAASLISGTSHRAWQHWEDGKRSVPVDVEREIFNLCDWRLEAIETIREIMNQATCDSCGRIVYYEKMIDWSGEPVLWRPHQSACAELHSHGVELVLFDSANYHQWLAGRDDSESLRGAWAAQVL